ALLVGVVYAKSFAFAGGRALIGVHHMEGHLFAPAIEDRDLAPPFVALLVSGGHTLLLDVPAWGRYRLLGETRDDAAGEAFDKVATLLGLGYPGGGAPGARRPCRRREPAPQRRQRGDDRARRLAPAAARGAQRLDARRPRRFAAPGARSRRTHAPRATHHGLTMTVYPFAIHL